MTLRLGGGQLVVCVKGEQSHTLTSEGADASEDGSGRGTPVVAVTPLAIRGRDDGAELELGPEGGPYNCLRAGDGGSSRQSLIAVTSLHENQRGELVTRNTASLTTGGGKPGQGYAAVSIDLRNATRDSGGSDEQSTGLGIREDGVSYGVAASVRAVPGVQQETIVRRLTPTECERLQGFPDGWTESQSDAQRYRQMGNAVAVPVVEWIARRLVAVDEGLS